MAKKEKNRKERYFGNIPRAFSGTEHAAATKLDLPPRMAIQDAAGRLFHTFPRDTA